MKNIWIIVFGILLFGVVTGIGIYYYTGVNNTPTPITENGNTDAGMGNAKQCNDYWWTDSSSLICKGPREFCGSYMYQGLRVYENEASCRAATPATSGNFTTFIDNELGITFNYPKLWGDVAAQTQNVRFSRLYKNISFTTKPLDFASYDVIEIDTRDLVEQHNKAFGGYGSGPVLTTTGWDDEKKLLKDHPSDGSVDCVQGVSALYKENMLCEVKTYGKNRFLIHYFRLPEEGAVMIIENIIYKDDLRYLVSRSVKYDQSGDIKFAVERARENSFYGAYEDILRSFDFITKY